MSKGYQFYVCMVRVPSNEIVSVLAGNEYKEDAKDEVENLPRPPAGTTLKVYSLAHLKKAGVPIPRGMSGRNNPAKRNPAKRATSPLAEERKNAKAFAKAAAAEVKKLVPGSKVGIAGSEWDAIRGWDTGYVAVLGVIAKSGASFTVTVAVNHGYAPLESSGYVKLPDGTVIPYRRSVAPEAWLRGALSEAEPNLRVWAGLPASKYRNNPRGVIVRHGGTRKVVANKRPSHNLLPGGEKIRWNQDGSMGRGRRSGHVYIVRPVYGASTSWTASVKPHKSEFYTDLPGRHHTYIGAMQAAEKHEASAKRTLWKRHA